MLAHATKMQHKTSLQKKNDKWNEHPKYSNEQVVMTAGPTVVCMKQLPKACIIHRWMLTHVNTELRHKPSERNNTQSVLNTVWWLNKTSTSASELLEPTRRGRTYVVHKRRWTTDKNEFTKRRDKETGHKLQSCFNAKDLTFEEFDKAGKHKQQCNTTTEANAPWTHIITHGGWRWLK